MALLCDGTTDLQLGSTSHVEVTSLRQPAPWRLSQRPRDSVPLVNHARQWQSGFDGAGDLAQHEPEVTPPRTRSRWWC